MEGDIRPIGGGGLSKDKVEAGVRDAAERLGIPGLLNVGEDEDKGGQPHTPINSDGDGKHPNERKQLSPATNTPISAPVITRV